MPGVGGLSREPLEDPDGRGHVDGLMTGGEQDILERMAQHIKGAENGEFLVGQEDDIKDVIHRYWNEVKEKIPDETKHRLRGESRQPAQEAGQEGI